jgi:hypothetical protein
MVRRQILPSVAAVVAALAATWLLTPIDLAGAAAAMSLTPPSGFVDAQQITATVTGLAAGEQIFLRECVVGEELDCAAASDIAQAGGAGAVTIPATLDALVAYSPQGIRTIADCRVPGTCELAAFPAMTAGPSLVRVPLVFTPGGPLRPLPTATVAPATGLEDGDIVHVTGSGFTGRAVVPSQPPPLAWAVVCTRGSNLLQACTSIGGILPIDPSGNLAGDAQVRALITEPTPVDCRTSPCELRVGWPEDPLGFARVPISFTPGSALHPATVTVTPATGLADGQQVAVHGEHLPPFTVHIDECRGGATSTLGCDLMTAPEAGGAPNPVATTTVGTSGTLDATAAVRRTIHVVPPDGPVAPWDCASAAGTGCEIHLGWDSPFELEPSTPITFGTIAPVAPVVKAVTATPSFTG